VAAGSGWIQNPLFFVSTAKDIEMTQQRRAAPPVTPPQRRPARIKEVPTKEQVARMTSVLMDEMIRDVQVKAGGDPNAAVSGDIGKTLIGLQLPSLSLEYALGNSVLPLEKVVQVYGQRGSCKSAFGFEVMRWIRALGGTGNLCEHESKYNDDWARSIIGWDERCMGVMWCHSTNQWQERLQEQAAMIKKKMLGTSKEKGMGKIFPYLQIVDSIMGKPAQETQDKIHKEGSAGRSFPLEALSISKFITTYATALHGWPFLLLCVNHLKVNSSDQGMAKKSRSGGQTIDFQGAFEIEVTRTGTQQNAQSSMNKLLLRVEKNSYGPDKRKIGVNVIWWDEDGDIDPETGKPLRRQRTEFDWNSSTVRMILEGEGAMWSEARKLTGLVQVNVAQSKSKLLNVKEPAPNRILGQRIHQNQDLMRELRRLLGIRTRCAFRLGVDYDEQVRDLRKRLLQTGQLKAVPSAKPS
jgi:hypothetical protein